MELICPPNMEITSAHYIIMADPKRFISKQGLPPPIQGSSLGQTNISSSTTGSAATGPTTSTPLPTTATTTQAKSMGTDGSSSINQASNNVLWNLFHHVSGKIQDFDELVFEHSGRDINTDRGM